MVDDPKIIWRVNRKPRFTVLELGEYMAADDGPRETMLRNMRFERLAPTLIYRLLYPAVSAFLTSPTRDRRILAKCREELDRALGDAKSPTQRDNINYEIRALETFERSLNAIEIGGINLTKAPPSKPLQISGVAVSVRPAAHIRAVRPRGGDLFGAIVVDVAKGIELKTDEAKFKSKAAMTHSAILLHQYATEAFGAADGKVSLERCIIFHSHRQDRVCAPSNYRRPYRNIEAVCRNIARSWDGIEPPPTFDKRFATSRN
jgi:hypothetical protein